MISFLMAELLKGELGRWQEGKEAGGLGASAGGTEVVRCQVGGFRSGESGEQPCGVCGRGVVGGSVRCVECLGWVRGVCGGILGKFGSSVGFRSGDVWGESSFAARGGG